MWIPVSESEIIIMFYKTCLSNILYECVLYCLCLLSLILVTGVWFDSRGRNNSVLPSSDKLSSKEIK